MNRSGWLMMGFVSVTCLVIIGGLLYLLLRDHRGADRTPRVATDPNRTAALETLDARLARGEIDVAEYQERRTALRSP